MSNLIEIRSDAQFNELVGKKDLVFILNFWASWAEPCQQMNEVFAELSTKFPALQFLKVKPEKWKKKSIYHFNRLKQKNILTFPKDLKFPLYQPLLLSR